MVVTAQRISKQIAKRDKNILKSLEEKIDRAILEQSSEEDFGDPNYYVSVDYLEEKVLDKIKKKYRAAGWYVTYRADSRGESETGESELVIRSRRK